MEQRKLRVIKTGKPGQQEVHGITIPPHIALFYPETFFSIFRTDKGILLISGTKKEYTDKELESVDLEDLKI